MSQTIQIPPRAAPLLVSRFGEQEPTPGAGDPGGVATAAPIRRFVERVLGPMVEGYFHAAANAADSVLDFMASHNEVRIELEQRVRAALAEWGVEAVRTTLNEFEPEDAGLDELRRQIVRERERKQMLEHTLNNVELEEAAERVRIVTEDRRRRTEVSVLSAQIDVLGRDAVALERFLEQLAKMNVPEFVGGDAASLLQYMPLPVAQDMINRAMKRMEAESEARAVRGTAASGEPRGLTGRRIESALLQALTYQRTLDAESGDGAYPGSLTIAIYLSDEPAHPAVRQSLKNLAEVNGWGIADMSEALTGSWFQTLRIRVRDAARSATAKDLMNEVRIAADLYTSTRLRAQADDLSANAAAKLIGSLEHTRHAVLLIGSTLIVKNDGVITGLSLTEDQLRLLEERPHLFTDPMAILVAFDGPRDQASEGGSSGW